MHSISEISKLIGVSPTTIRQWERYLEGIITIPRDEKGIRMYGENELNILTQFYELRKQGMGLESVRLTFLGENPTPYSSPKPNLSAIPLLLSYHQTLRDLEREAELLWNALPKEERLQIRKWPRKQTENLDKKKQFTQDYIDEKLEGRLLMLIDEKTTAPTESERQ